MEMEMKMQWNHPWQPVVVQYDKHGCSPDTTNHWECQGEHPYTQVMPWWPRESIHHRRRRNGRSRRSRCLGLWPLRLTLGLASSNGYYIYGTHNRKAWRFKVGDGRMVKNPCDSRRGNEPTTGRRILLDIYKGEYEVRGKFNSKSLK